jgi:hypothetical protein
MAILKKWIRANNEEKINTIIHYDMAAKVIPNIETIIPMKPLWPLALYLTHRENN